MNKMKKLTVAGLVAVLAVAAVAAFVPASSVYAVEKDAIIAGGGGGGGGGNKAAGAAKSGFDEVNKTVGASDDLHGSVGVILNIVYSIIGIVAVVMVVIGGVSYATSQGDPGRLKKAKDTILYGIIGLVIVLMAFAITNFVLDALSK